MQNQQSATFDNSLKYLRFAHTTVKFNEENNIKPLVLSYTNSIFNSEQIKNIHKGSTQAILPDDEHTIISSDGNERCVIFFYNAKKGVNESIQHIYHFAENKFLGMWERDLQEEREKHGLKKGVLALLEKRVSHRCKEIAFELNSKVA